LRLTAPTTEQTCPATITSEEHPTQPQIDKLSSDFLILKLARVQKDECEYLPALSRLGLLSAQNPSAGHESCQYLFRKGSLWLLRYYDSEFAVDGSIRRVQKTKKLAVFGVECPNKTAAQDLARDFLKSINLARRTPESAMTLARFAEDRYLPFVKEHKRISTYHGYRNMWKRYLKPRSELMLREFRTVDGERILESIAKDNELTSTTFAHIKALLSGIFRYAKRQGVINSENPMRDVVLPTGKPPGETHATLLRRSC
jgi:hypothetical protein